ADGERVGDLQTGESFRVAVTVRGLRRLDEWALGFSIDTASGVLALASNTSMLGATVPPLREGETVTVEIDVDSAHFNPGSYWVNANLHGISESTSHALTQGAEFTVHGRSDSLGSV
ncbi:hypothetical protein TB15x_23570, partial [Xanthomonas perforans]